MAAELGVHRPDLHADVAAADYDSALRVIEQSLALKEEWFNLWIKATIVAAKGNRKEAIALGEKSYELGKKAEMFFLEGEIKKTLADWKRKGGLYAPP